MISASWFLVPTYLIWIFGSKLILSNNQSSATLFVRDTCLIVRLLLRYNHLDLLLRFFENVQHRTKVRKFCVCSNMIDIDQFEIVSVGVFLYFYVGAFS